MARTIVCDATQSNGTQSCTNDATHVVQDRHTPSIQWYACRACIVTFTYRLDGTLDTTFTDYMNVVAISPFAK